MGSSSHGPALGPLAGGTGPFPPAPVAALTSGKDPWFSCPSREPRPLSTPEAGGVSSGHTEGCAQLPNSGVAACQEGKALTGIQTASEVYTGTLSRTLSKALAPFQNLEGQGHGCLCRGEMETLRDSQPSLVSTKRGRVATWLTLEAVGGRGRGAEGTERRCLSSGSPPAPAQGPLPRPLWGARCARAGRLRKLLSIPLTACSRTRAAANAERV